jgi:YesN/AraC family two-component response regulator
MIHPIYHRLCKLRDWYVHHEGIGRIKSIDEIEQILASTKAKPGKDIAMPDKGPLIQAIPQGDTVTIGEWLTSFFAAAEDDNIYNHTFELLDYIYTVFVSPNKALTKYLDDKPRMFKKLSYIESIHLLKDVTQSQILKIMNEIITTENADFCLIMIKKVQRYVESHYQEAFTVEALSESLNYSPNYIRSIFKKYTGETLLEYITNLRMERALQLLLDTTVRIGDITYKVGYSNPSYFCSQFNKKYGMTPQQYRSKMQQ